MEEELQDLFAYFRRFKHFGNGRFARDVLQRAIINHATGISSEDTDTASPSLALEAKDIPDRRSLMDCVEGYESTAEELDVYKRQYVRYASRGFHKHGSNHVPDSKTAQDTQGPQRTAFLPTRKPGRHPDHSHWDRRR